MATKKTPGKKPRSMPEQARKLLGLFKAEDRVLVLIAADPDALGSALAVKRLLWRRVANVTIASVNKMTRPDNLAMVRLLNIPVVMLSEVDPKTYSKRVMVDSQPGHHKEFPELTINAVIDHHPLGDSVKGCDFVDIRPKYGATSSIMTEYLKAAGITPSVRLATALTFGIKTDTYSFGRQALEEDVKAFRYLFTKASHSMLRKIEFSEMRVKDLGILRQALENFVIRRHCMYTHLGKVQSPDNLVQIADFFLKVDLVDASAVSGVFREKLIIILRNVAPRGNAGKLAEAAFGGWGSAGGHKAMARAEIELDKLKDVAPGCHQEDLRNWVMKRLQTPPPRKKK